ncbi:aminotransferase [Ancylobacter sp. WKF20]|uniref:aminotransferase n=1 Tax=Ancylobacter sp. WKF20 TaxID=3039801 RepID=UPI00243449FE|nr:aminotransferase [Ancylobacter sp. WKF20]WGD29721.1 aminotransferase [Ancylobacter sp. WKF20]
MLNANSPYLRDIRFHLHTQTDARVHEETGPFIARQGDGVFIIDPEGNRLLEGMAGLWCTSLGFSEKRLADAAYAQMLRMPYHQNFAHRSSDPVIDLAEALIARAPQPMSKVMFLGSGSEAVDTAIKVAWYYNAARGKTQKRKIIGRMRGYHGSTIGSASLTGLPNMHQGWGLPLPGFFHVSCPHFYREGLPGETEEAFATRLANELDALIEREGADTVAAFFAEPVMGTGGVIIPPATYFEKIQAVLKKHDVLLVADEVICGFGRTGTYWGCDTFAITPDMVTCAKGLSSAYLPISGLMLSDAIYQVIADQTHALGGFGHGFTYGGHPVSAAVALETLKLYDEYDILANVQAQGARLAAGLAALGDHPLVGEVRAIGLMAAIEIVADKQSRASFPLPAKVPVRLGELVKKRGVLLRPLGQSLCFAPPLIVKETEIAMIIKAVAESLDELAGELRAEGTWPSTRSSATN